MMRESPTKAILPPLQLSVSEENDVDTGGIEHRIPATKEDAKY
jgi:hypothetical protein